jgi:hypothetical protein
MKTERRHELHTNVLANAIGHQVETVRPYFKIGGLAIVAVAVLCFAAMYFYKARAAADSEAWEDYYTALSERDTSRLKTVAEDRAKTQAGVWALESEAELALAQGLASMFVDRNEAKTQLRRAKNSFTEVLKETSANSLAGQRSQFGLGQVNEAQGDLEAARKCYEAVIRDAGETTLAKSAQERLDLLARPDVDKWYGWFSRQKPTPPAKPGTMGGLPGLPGLPSQLSDKPDMSVPPAPGAGTPPAQPAAEPAKPADASKPADVAKPADNATATPPAASGAPAAPNPGEAKPADPAKPAEAAAPAAPPASPAPAPAAPEKPAGQ